MHEENTRSGQETPDTQNAEPSRSQCAICRKTSQQNRQQMTQMQTYKRTFTQTQHQEASIGSISKKNKNIKQRKKAEEIRRNPKKSENRGKTRKNAEEIRKTRKNAEVRTIYAGGTHHLCKICQEVSTIGTHH